MTQPNLQALIPEGWKRAQGWSHGIVTSGTGRYVHVAGQLAQDGATGELVGKGDFAAQWEKALENLVTVVRTAGGEPTAIASMLVFITSVEAFNQNRAHLGDAWTKHLGRWFPAMTVVEVRSLVDPAAMIEIEAVAVVE